MCWTSNRVDKLKYFKEIGLWYIPDEDESADSSKSSRQPAYCYEPKHMVAWGVEAERNAQKGQSEVSLVDRCCLKDKFFQFQEHI
jgi:hypothetical protein